VIAARSTAIQLDLDKRLPSIPRRQAAAGRRRRSRGIRRRPLDCPNNGILRMRGLPGRRAMLASYRRQGLRLETQPKSLYFPKLFREVSSGCSDGAADLRRAASLIFNGPPPNHRQRRRIGAGRLQPWRPTPIPRSTSCLASKGDLDRESSLREMHEAVRPACGGCSGKSAVISNPAVGHESQSVDGSSCLTRRSGKRGVLRVKGKLTIDMRSRTYGQSYHERRMKQRRKQQSGVRIIVPCGMEICPSPTASLEWARPA